MVAEITSGFQQGTNKFQEKPAKAAVKSMKSSHISPQKGPAQRPSPFSLSSKDPPPESHGLLSPSLSLTIIQLRLSCLLGGHPPEGSTNDFTVCVAYPLCSSGPKQEH